MDYYLYIHENPHASQRSNGLQFWGYPTRRGVTPDVIVIHTAENIPDTVPPDTGAESIARYFATTSRPASAHTVTDSDSTIRLLPDEATAFHVRNYNTRSWGLEIATQARRWDQLPITYKQKLLIRAAREAARVATKFGIPVAYRTKTQIDSGLPGFTGHTNLDPTRRSDPGFDLGDWTYFLGLVRHYQDGDTMAHEHTPPAGQTHSWADAAWAAWVEASGTGDDTRSWKFQREDMSWVYERTIQPLEEQLAALEARVTALEANQSIGGVPFGETIRITGTITPTG